jgi:hypothetical protein
LVFRSALDPTHSSTKKRYIPDLALGVLALIFAFIALISPATVMRIPEVLLSISISVMFNGFGKRPGKVVPIRELGTRCS